MAPIYPLLQVRQSGGSGASCNCISGGAIAGIVIGSIAGTLLMLWLIWTVRLASSGPVVAESSVGPSRKRKRRRTSTRESRSAYVRENGKTYRVRAPSKVYGKPE